MLIALWWLLAALGGLVLAVLVLPVKLDLSLRTSPGWRFRVDLRLFGGLTPALPVHDNARPERKKAKPAVARKKPAARRRSSSGRALRAVTAAPRLLMDLLRPITLERLMVDADIGLGDPADTGQFAGLLSALVHAQPPRAGLAVAVRPDFSALRVDGQAEARLSFIPFAFLPPGVRFAWRVFGPQ